MRQRGGEQGLQACNDQAGDKIPDVGHIVGHVECPGRSSSVKHQHNCSDPLKTGGKVGAQVKLAGELLHRPILNIEGPSDARE